MILTITPNPSIDLLYETDALVWDDANRVEAPRRRPGGQGINLTRAVRVLGAESVALAFMGGRTGQELQNLLGDDATPHVALPIAAETRTFVAVRETVSGRSMLVNPRGPVLTADDRACLLDKVRTLCRELRPQWVVCSGSVPRGVGDDLYAQIARIAHRCEARFVADCDGAALALAMQSGSDLLAPNQHEAGRLLDTRVASVPEAVAAARSLTSAAPRVLIKLGEAGALLADGRKCWHAHGRKVDNGSAVGAGDAFLAAFLVADQSGAPPDEALRCAVAAGTAVLLSQGTALLSYDDYAALLRDVAVTPVN
jgi:1-phosphofructokinase family hexose kinase